MLCSVKQICPRQRSRQTGLPRRQANAAHAGGGFSKSAAMLKIKNEAGKRFGLLTVISFDHMNRIAFWKCKCDCGKSTVVASTKLRSGATKSCGCLRKTWPHDNFTTHALSKTKAYRCWAGMIQRCENENVKSFKNYGRRGIKVCARWHKFENFFTDMGEKPAGMTIERKNNDGNYCSSNCIWASRKVQANNRRKPELTA